jgi:hypothetical protein
VAIGLEQEAFIFLKDAADFPEEFELRENLIGAVVRPVTDEAAGIAISEPVATLLDGGLFEVVEERALAGGGRATWQNISSGVCHASKRKGRGVRKGR